MRAHIGVPKGRLQDKGPCFAGNQIARSKINEFVGSRSSQFQGNSFSAGVLRVRSAVSPRTMSAAPNSRTFLYLQRTVGNAFIARALEPRSQLRQSDQLTIQRQSLNPLAWAGDLLHHITGDAETDGAQVQGEATERVNNINDQGMQRSKELQGTSDTQSTALQNEASTEGTQVSTQADTQGRELQTQNDAETGQLTAELSTNSAAIQQDATGTSTKLQGDVRALDAQTRSHVGEASKTMDGDVNGLHAEGESTDGQIRNQWAGVENQGNVRVKLATDQTQALVNDKTSLIQEYQGAGQHDPNQFQKRWTELQNHLTAAERGEPNLQQTENAGSPISAQAGGLWSRITNRGQTLATKAISLASAAWSTLQNGWATMQRGATTALANVRQRASAAVARVKSLATAAWTKLQNLAGQVSSRLRDLATRAWTGLQSRGTAAWVALSAAATAAWTALQTAANSIIATLTSKVSGILSRISGAVGRIVQYLASAVSSLISRVRSITDRALSFLRSGASKAWDGLRTFGSHAWQGLKDIAEKAWTGLKDLGTRAWTSLKNLGTRIWSGLKALGTRIWNGLQSLAKHAWDMLGKAWDWLKKKAEAAWKLVKKAWEAVKRAALKAWDWIKKKARAALEWLKRKWAWLKAMISKVIAWLKAKWKWLKSIVKITIRIPDITLVKRQSFKPWKFVDLDSGRIPLAKVVLDTPAGPVELAALARAQADATISGWICPCTLKNIRITLQPLISRYTGQADLHIPGNIQEGVSITGTIGGSGNYGGAVGIIEGGLKATGTARGFGSLVISPRIVYDSGKVSFSERFRLEFCINPIISLDAFARLVATTAAPPSSGGGGGGTPILPPGPIMSGSHAAGGTHVPTVATPPGAKPKKPKEKILWEGNWHIGSISKIECWKIGAKYTLTFEGGLPELDVEFDAKQVSLGEVIRKILEDVKPSGGGKGPSVDILTDTTASGICKCVGDDACGGGRRYKVCVRTQKDCKNSQKDVDDFCNNNNEMKERCRRPKCYYRHTQATCPDDCEPGVIEPLTNGGGGGGTCAMPTEVRNGPFHAPIDEPSKAGMEIAITISSSTGKGSDMATIQDSEQVGLTFNHKGSFATLPPMKGSTSSWMPGYPIPNDRHTTPKSLIVDRADKHGGDGSVETHQLDIFTAPLCGITKPQAIPNSGYIIRRIVETGPGRRITLRTEKEPTACTVNGFSTTAGPSPAQADDVVVRK